MSKSKADVDTAPAMDPVEVLATPGHEMHCLFCKTYSGEQMAQTGLLSSCPVTQLPFVELPPRQVLGNGQEPIVQINRLEEMHQLSNRFFIRLIQMLLMVMYMVKINMDMMIKDGPLMYH